jgi:hypothetical protein
VIIPISDTVGTSILVPEVVTAGGGACNPTPINEAAAGVTMESVVGARKLIAPPVVGILATAAPVMVAITALVVAVTVSSAETTPWA